MTPAAPSKKQTLLAFLQRGVTMVHLDARRPGVSVPPHLADDAHLRLNLSYRYQIPDLEVGDDRVVATLSFGGRPFQCILPWSAVFAITNHASGDGQVWPEDLPVEVMKTLAERQSEGSETPTGSTPAGGQRPVLKAIENEPEETQADDASEPAPEPEEPKPDGGAPKRSHLRLVR